MPDASYRGSGYMSSALRGTDVSSYDLMSSTVQLKILNG